MKRRLIVIAGVIAAALAITATAGLIVIRPLQRVQVTVSSPTQLVALRPSTWTFVIHNLGPDIGNLGLQLGGAGGWMESHRIVYASGCLQPAQAGVLLCGTLRQGATTTIAVTAAPSSAGTYSYISSFCDCGQSGVLALAGPSAPQFGMVGSRPTALTAAWTETVLSAPSAPVSVVDIYGMAVSGATITVNGSFLTALTDATGLAHLALGPLTAGTYTVVASGTGSISGSAEITVPAAGDPPSVSITLASAAAALSSGSHPDVLPGAVLVADEDNNRLVELSPQGQLIWVFPRPGDLGSGETFIRPDDAFFTPDGTQIIATQEEDFTVSLIDIATHKIVWRYGEPGTHGSGPNQLWNPDDAMVMSNGDVLISDIVNCRIIVVAQGQHSVARSYGHIGWCHHNPPTLFGSPNGAFPLADGNWLVTEINGDWVSELAPGGAVVWSTHAPLVSYPSDSNEMGPDRYITVDYSYPGQVVIFDHTGKTLWRYRPLGAAALDHPSLALGLPGGDVLLNDDYNHRVMVVDPRTDQVVWQYGVTGRAGSSLGMLNHPDGVDLAPPYSLLGSHVGPLQAP
ncbi:MAG: PQQ-binding-like beta-propeller repeat protein [Candidatus Dormibacterales bacterium]